MIDMKTHAGSDPAVGTTTAFRIIEGSREGETGERCERRLNWVVVGLRQGIIKQARRGGAWRSLGGALAWRDVIG